MKWKLLAAAVATLWLTSVGHAELNTWTHISVDGGGSGDVQGDLTGAGEVTIFEQTGVGDAWNGGDQFTFLYDDARQTESFSAQVRVVSQTEAVEGRWGKAGIAARVSLDGNSANAMAQVAAGNGSQAAPPSSGAEQSIVPIRLAGRSTNDGQNGYEISAGYPNNVFPETTDVPAPANRVWLRLDWDKRSNEYTACAADDISDAPGTWYCSVPNTIAPPEEGGLYVGLGYSAHNSLADPLENDLHGITFDNYSIKALSTGIDVDGVLELTGALSDVVRGDDIISEGLAQDWIDGNFRNNPNGMAAATPVNAEPFTTPWTWFSGSQGSGLFPKYPNHPALAGTKFAGNPGNVDNYAVRWNGEIFLEAGDYVIRDGIDDYTMVRIDLNGNGTFEGDLLPAPGDSNGSNDEVVIHDDAWNNINGEGGNLATADEEGFFSVDADDWYKIEAWMGEAGGGDGGVLYLTREDTEQFDEWPEAGFDARLQALYTIPNSQLRTVLPGELQTATSTAVLEAGTEYVVEVNSALLQSDTISVADPGGNTTRKLDVSSGIVRVVADGELVPGDEFVIFDAEELIGEESLELIFDDPSQWDASGLGVDGLGGHRIRFLGPGGLLIGDCDGDGALTGADLACITTVDERDAVLAAINSFVGDFDGMGGVAFADFLRLSTNFNQPGTYSQGNANMVGNIDFADFLLLSTNFNRGVGAAESVPEPSSALLFGLGGLLLGLVRRRRS